MNQFSDYFAKRIKCTACDGVGKILDRDKIVAALPATHPAQPGLTCGYCNGLGYTKEATR